MGRASRAAALFWFSQTWALVFSAWDAPAESRFKSTVDLIQPTCLASTSMLAPCLTTLTTTETWPWRATDAQKQPKSG